MKFEEFLERYRGLPIIDTETLLVGLEEPGPIRVYVSRWLKGGKLVQLRRGFYVLSKNYRSIEPFGPAVAALLIAPYISCEKALEFHGLIPEAVGVYTSVTTKRQAKFHSEIGLFEYRHIKPSLFWGYNSVSLDNQTGFMASCEKALLDFFYFKRIHAGMEYIEELRLQNLEAINIEKIRRYASLFNKPGMISLVRDLEHYIKSEIQETKTL